MNDKDAIYELQKIDCNCNDCFYFKRDFELYAKWEEWNKGLQLIEFEKKKAEAYEIAKSCPDPKGVKTLTALADKMKFQFDKDSCLTYGDCLKYNKPKVIIPAICQADTQHCFVHRKDGNMNFLTLTKEQVEDGRPKDAYDYLL